MRTTHSRLSATLAALLIALLSFMAAGTEAQPAAQPPLRVSLLTCGPGKEIYQLEGHTALRLQKQPSAGKKGYDLVVNWGVFDFDTPNFVYRFVKGETDYMACAYPFDIFMEEYRHEGRRVVEQVIGLTPEQTFLLEALVARNIQPENRTYRYNYVKDNCATRPLAMLEAALGKEITLPGDSIVPDGVTFRSEMTHYHADYPWYQFGIDLALGSGLDYDITNRQRTFAPVFLEKELAGATVADTDGHMRPVVGETLILNSGDGKVTADATPWLLSPAGVGVMLLVVTFILSYRDIRRKRLSRWFDTILYGVMFLAGCVITFLVFISSHEATSPNWLLLWLNPLCIIPAAGIWIKRCKRVVYCYQICNFAALILLLAGHRFFGQALNTAFPLFILCDLMRSLTQIYICRNGVRHEGTTIVSGHAGKASRHNPTDKK